MRRNVADALALADLIGRMSDEETARAVDALLRPHLGPGSLVTPFFLEKPPVIRERLLREQVAPVAERALLPALGATVRERMAGRDSGPSAIEAASALKTLTDWLAGGGFAAAGRALCRDLGRHLEDSAAATVDGLVDRLRRSDVPDVSELSSGLLRLEAMRWVLEELGDHGALKALAWYSRRLAVASLDRAAATIETFLANRDLMTLFDTIGLLSQVDAMILVVSRVLEAGPEVGEERTAFVETCDEAALARFTKVLPPLSDVLAQAALRAVGWPEANQTLFQGAVRQLGYLHRLCRHLRHDQRPAALIQAERHLDEHLIRLIKEIDVSLTMAVNICNRARSQLCLDQAAAVRNVLPPESG